MPIIHNFTDEVNKKEVPWLVIIVLVIIVSSLIYIIIPKQKNNLLEVTADLNIELCLDNDLPTTIKEIYDNPQYISEENNQNCKKEIVRNPKDTNPYTLIHATTYIPVINIKDELEAVNIDQFIQSLNSQKYNGYEIIWNKQTDEFLKSKYIQGAGQTTYTDDEIEKKISQNEKYIAIIPFENKRVFEKELSINSTYTTDNGFLLNSYPFVDLYWIKGDVDREQILKILGENNFNPEKLTTIITSGVSYIGSDKYQEMIDKYKDPSYMVGNISTITKSADIFSISNEVSISSRCYQRTNSVYLCSREKDMAVLKTLGVDIIGLTGNHILDFGLSDFNKTITYYNSKNIKYYGGGVNETDAHTPKIIENNGTKIAFLGYNFIPPFSYYSTKTKAGSANVSEKIMKNDIDKATKLADILIVDMQFGSENDTSVSKTNKENAKLALTYGADIVQGVNSNITLPMSIYDNKAIFYGLGSFISAKGSRGVIIKHFVYDKRYIGFELIPITKNSDLIIELETDKQRYETLNKIYDKMTITYEN